MRSRGSTRCSRSIAGCSTQVDPDRAVAVMTSAVRDATNGGDFAERCGLALRPRDPRVERRRGGAPHLPRRDRHDRPRPRRRPDAGVRHRRRLNRARARPRRQTRLPCLHAGRRRAPGRPAYHQRPTVNGRTQRDRPGRPHDPHRRCPAGISRATPTGRSVSPARRPHWQRSPNASTPTTRSASTGTG